MLTVTTDPGEDRGAEDWARQYDESAGLYQALCDEVEFSLKNALTDAGIKVHSAITRVKTKSSFLEKVRRKNYANPIKQMGDLVGARLVCLFLEDVPSVENVIRETFEILEYEDKGKVSPPEIWRYSSVHFNCKLGDSHSGARYNSVKHQQFEIQVRTILQDAWASVEHHLAYKGKDSIPDELKRDISALAGLFHVADNSFQQINHSSRRLDESASRRLTGLIDQLIRGQEITADVTIDRSTAKALLRELYPDRMPADDLEYSRFVDELAAVNIRSIGELRALLDENKSRYQDYEDDAMPIPQQLGGYRYFFADVGFARGILDKAVKGYADNRHMPQTGAP
ncbi:RelA/SpoT domain-containing protein [Mycobacteroides abscessus]|uniref:RelA/SpoT domain-containing protein n=1 Tax=Mycobacteroides abscessus subsp. massiliense TaxID=1962118 RepID=A0AB38DJ15_9MYCO|nr:hypothetical protein A3N96_08965 [Mycobacteroides abscessus]SKD37652.1 RelA/SpoT domain-containing protein [Mycobacteroides abscessus subsp. massiliense]AMU35248.1 hypothetical protein A3N98_08425 [Mycobacteroides abscessus]AMU40251.1 hypothetical protein A3N99_08755 [Mycobacteroides abscessus]AMU60239.1 hypothetical protein A3O03_08955 [Mycobacteroides abscessus]